MVERKEETPPDLTAQVRRHLESLRSAGVEWLPAAAPPSLHPSPPGGEGRVRGEAAVPSPAPTEAPVVPVTAARSLFETEIVAEAPAVLSVEQRRQELQVLANQVSGCTRCQELASTRTQTVFGVGRIDPDVCFIGEAPGRDEDAQGEPFVGPAGQLLTRIIAAMGMKREDVYICNILRCRPPNNRLPLPDEAANCREWLDRTLELVRPKFLCALGGTAAKFLLGTTQGITRLRGKFFTYRGVPVMCTFHPAFLLRTPENKREVWEDMKVLLAKMGRPVPSK